MSEYFVSFAVRNDIAAIVISEDGMILKKYVKRIPSNVDGSYNATIYALNMALKHLDRLLQGRRSEVTFEHSNYIIEKWIERHYSKPEYQEAFDAAMQKLQRLPIRYTFVHNDKPKAAMYCSEKYIKKEEFVS